MPALTTTPRRWLISVAALACLAVLFPVAPPSAEAATTPMLVFSGRGWGHGRGMSQYGAQGYATKHGWNYQQILGHYYGNTKAGTVDNSAVSVRLDGMRNATTITIISDGAPMTINGSAINAAYRQVELRWDAARGHWASFGRVGSADAWTSLGGKGARPLVERNGPGSLQVNGQNYPGSIQAWAQYGRHAFHRTTGWNFETIAHTNTETYLQGVVPNESPASWHIEALKAQAVAARSYMRAGDSRWQIDGEQFATTCDSTWCQVYKPNSAHTNTNTAIAATAGQVRRFASNNAIARTEFSSTSGGWTAGGDFPAVQDLGDSISPLHTWSTTVSAEPLQRAYGGGSALTSITVTSRNGYGEWGGRTLKVRLSFANGTTRDVYGDDVRRTLGLRSTWFAVSIQNAAADKYINAAYQLFVRRNATAAELERWRDTVARGGRDSLTAALSVSDEWAGAEIRELYRRVLRREPDNSGYNYWLARVREGHKIENIAVYFYGGEEYFARNGSNNRSFVTALYRDILGRSPDSGLDYWTGQLDSRRASRIDVAAGFYAGVESRTQRVTRLYQVILRRSPDASGRAYWVGQLLHIGDVRLAAYLAASDEFYRRVT